MRKIFLIPLLFIFVIGCGSKPKDHAYIHVEPLIFIPTTTTMTIPPTTTTQKPPPVKKIVTQKPVENRPKSSGEVSGVCGGILPPCYVLDRESGYGDGDPNTYNPNARNPSGCSGRGCYGKWQCDPNTCDGTGTEEQQNAEAARVWDNGRGCSHWDAC